MKVSIPKINRSTARNSVFGAIYGRASTDALVEAESLKKQEYNGLQYASLLSVQLGIEHVVKYVLIERYAASGADRDRKELKRLIILIKTGKIKFLIIEELSRLSRILVHLLELLELCKQYGVAVYIRSLPGVNLHSAAGEMLIGMLGSAAQFERSLTIERVKSTLRAAALREGKINGGAVIYGFKKDKTKKGSWVPVPEELKNIEIMMEKFVATGSISQTIEFANSLGIKNKTGRSFDYTNLKKLFENRKLIGELVVIHGLQDEQQTVVPLPFGEVINRDLFDRVQVAIKQHEGLRANLNRRGDKIYLLTGLLQHIDGSTFAGQSGTCRNGTKLCYYFNTKNKTRIEADKFEEKILKCLASTFENEVELEEKSKTLSDTKTHQIKLLEKRISELKQELLKISEKETGLLSQIPKISGGSDTVTQWLEGQIHEITQSRKNIGEQLQELEEQKQSLNSMVSDLKKIKTSALNIFRKMKKAEPLAQRQFLRQVVEKIEISHTGEVKIIWKVLDLFTDVEEVVASDIKWLRRRDSNPRPSG